MYRRNLVVGALGLTTGAAPDLATIVEDVIFGRVAEAPLPGHQLAAQLAAARADFRSCRYSQLAQATAGRDQAPASQAGQQPAGYPQLRGPNRRRCVARARDAREAVRVVNTRMVDRLMSLRKP